MPKFPFCFYTAQSPVLNGPACAVWNGADAVHQCVVGIGDQAIPVLVVLSLYG